MNEPSAIIGLSYKSRLCIAGSRQRTSWLSCLLHHLLPRKLREEGLSQALSETCQAPCQSFCIRARRLPKHAGHRAGHFESGPGVPRNMPGTEQVICIQARRPRNMPGTVPVILYPGQASCETCQAPCRSFCSWARRPPKHAGHRAGHFVSGPGVLRNMPGTVSVILYSG